MKVRLKCFIASKEHGAICKDSLAVNLKNWRFAVADGVTNSNHSEIVSRLLSNSFIESETPVSDWLTEFNESILSSISLRWKEEEEKSFSQLIGRQQLQAKIRRNYFSPGASTFAGFEIDNDQRQVSYLILGDSTLFVIGKDDSYFAVNSNAESNKKGELLPFDNIPGNIVANGTINGDWITGCKPLQEGYFALMTDGCAKWFQTSFLGDESILDQLWNLSNNEDFVNFANHVWKQNPQYEDDWAVILLKIENDELELIYFPEDQLQANLINFSASEDSIAIVDHQDNDSEQLPQTVDANALSTETLKPQNDSDSNEVMSGIKNQFPKCGNENHSENSAFFTLCGSSYDITEFDNIYDEPFPLKADENSTSETREQTEITDVSTETISQNLRDNIFSDSLQTDRNDNNHTMVIVEKPKNSEIDKEIVTKLAEDTSVEMLIKDNLIRSNQNEGIDTYNNTEHNKSTNNE